MAQHGVPTLALCCHLCNLPHHKEKHTTLQITKPPLKIHDPSRLALIQGWLIVASFLSQPEPVSPLISPPPTARVPALAITTAKDCNALSSTYGSRTGEATVHSWQSQKKSFCLLHLHFPPTTTGEVGSPFSWHG